MRVPSKNRIALYAVLLLSVAWLYGCGGRGASSSSSGGYGYGDGPPLKDIDVSGLPDAMPKLEPITKAGNKNPYTVMGETYQLLPTSSGYREHGIASWYGNKFHGRKTSNGETYDMYGMTAAHKTLPIPSYVRVTNMENGRSVVVRVNDRGPFHGGRIIDISYAGAKKLGYSANGTANVEVVAIDPRDYQPNAVVQPHIVETPVVVSVKPTIVTDNIYLQVGSFSTQVAADRLSERLQGMSEYPVVIRQSQEPQSLYKVLVGPVEDKVKLLDLSNLLQQSENLSPFVIYE
ncbi:MAG: rare lipoprotein A [Porticoccus sp.]